ncbi:hypothetical protein [Endozoicomonas sp. ALD040]|uniref:hypothetical protein n=1 Tax=unclassified Endozoicomonas TaxID=2644528 RepID=UPI003BB09EDC
MPLPESLQGDRWTEYTARTVLPLIVWCAKNGKTITYGQLDQEIISRGWGHHVLPVQYGYPAGAIGEALIETEEEWEESIPPLNAIIVNAKTGLPGKGVNYYVERYSEPDEYILNMSLDDKQALIEEVHSDIFAYEYWDDVLELYELEPLDGAFAPEGDEDEICPPSKGGWSDCNESDEHKNLKEYVSENPEEIELENIISTEQEYLFASGDRADIVFSTDHNIYAVEVKSIRSNKDDLNRGIFQCIKYQALLRAEQRALGKPPTARAMLVTERELPLSLQNLADTLSIYCYVIAVNDA